MNKNSTYFKPTTVEEAIAIAHAHSSDFRYLAGGTDVMVNKFHGNENSSCLIDLTAIEELKRVEKENDFLKIGSLVRLDELKNYFEIKNEFPVLIESACSVGSPVIRKTATIGGNILCENRCIYYNQSEWWREAAGFCLKCNGDICIATGGKKACFSRFISDTAPALISMDAQVETTGKKGAKITKMEGIYTGDGINSRNLKKCAIIKSILLPLNQEFHSSFKKLRLRESMDFSSLTTTVTVNKNKKLKIVLGGVDPQPIVIEATTESDNEELIKQALKSSRAIDNEIFSRNYRREMVKVFLRKSFTDINRKFYTK